jgi:hypothetical protein
MEFHQIVHQDVGHMLQQQLDYYVDSYLNEL